MKACKMNLSRLLFLHVLLWAALVHVGCRDAGNSQPHTVAEGPSQIAPPPDTLPSAPQPAERDTLFSVVTLNFAPRQTQLSDSLAEVLILAIQRNITIPALHELLSERATLKVLATPASLVAVAKSRAKRRALGVQRYLVNNWSALSLIERNYDGIHPRVLPIDSAQLAGGQGLPGSVEVIFQGRKFPDMPLY
jgi:hypothetical protein